MRLSFAVVINANYTLTCPPPGCIDAHTHVLALHKHSTRCDGAGFQGHCVAAVFDSALKTLPFASCSCNNGPFDLLGKSSCGSMVTPKTVGWPHAAQTRGTAASGAHAHIGTRQRTHVVTSRVHGGRQSHQVRVVLPDAWPALRWSNSKVRSGSALACCVPAPAIRSTSATCSATLATLCVAHEKGLRAFAGPRNAPILAARRCGQGLLTRVSTVADA